ncbi:MAG: TolC family protein [Elusimicrobia bacterium]|nr:TolC family protein [Elusimicrobiota bacterium]
MARLIFSFFLLALASSFVLAEEFSTSTMRGINLGEAYSLSLSRSETLALQGQEVELLRGAEQAARAAFRPYASFNGTQFYQDTPSAGVSGSNTATSRRTGALNAQYDVFSGMRDYLSLRASTSDTESARLALSRARQVMYVTAGNAYLDLFLAQAQIRVRQRQIQVALDRVKELQERERLGRSRKSEVLAAEAGVAQYRAQLRQELGQERVAQQSLQFLTGLETDLAPQSLPGQDNRPLETCLATIDSRADILAAGKTLESADLRVQTQRRQLWPTLSADANYYLDRTDTYSGIKWDFTASLQFPLYTGGKVSAQVSQAQSSRNMAAISLELAKRQARTEVRQYYDKLHFAQATVAARENALDWAQRNFQAQSADYRYGLVANMDVLSSMNDALSASLELLQARAEESRAAMELEVAMGGPGEASR